VEALRFYIDKNLTADGGGDHSRTLDVADLNVAEARVQVEATLVDETINQVVSITIDPDNHPVLL
jgi:hypothetical protein